VLRCPILKAGRSSLGRRAGRSAGGPTGHFFVARPRSRKLAPFFEPREEASMGYSVVDVADIPYVWGTFKFVRHHLGATAFGFAQIDFPPDKVGSEHDETQTGQEEVYLTLSGSGTIEIDGEPVEMKPGRYVLVGPDSRRRPSAGPDGMSFLVIGGVPGGVYEPRELPER
jgi:quercetin dioxygenase-like cupin family protein